MNKFSKLVYLSRKVPGLYRLIRFFYKCDIARSVKMGGGIVFGHDGLGTVIGGNTIIGNNVFIQHHVTMGVRWQGDGNPIIGDNVRIGAYAIILGPIHIGDNSVIGAGTIVTHDVPANTIFYNKKTDQVVEITEQWEGKKEIYHNN